MIFDSKTLLDVELNPPDYNPPKKPVIFILISLLVFLSVFFIIVTIKIINNLKRPANNPNISNVNVVVSPTRSVSPSLVPQSETSYIAYLKDNNLWIVNPHTDLKIELLVPESDFFIINPTINNNNVLFSYCKKSDNNCVIKSIDIATKSETSILDAGIPAFNFTINKNAVSYMDSNSVYVYTEGQKTKIFEFVELQARGEGLQDQTLIKYSPDGSHFLVVNTQTQPNLKNDKNTLWVFDEKRNLTLAIESATNGFWWDNENIAYKSGNKVFLHNIITGIIKEIAEVNGVMSDVSKKRNELIYWNVNEEGFTKTAVFDIASKKEKLSIDNFIKSYWYDDDNLIGTTTENSPNESIFGYIELASAKYNILTAKITPY